MLLDLHVVLSELLPRWCRVGTDGSHGPVACLSSDACAPRNTSPTVRPLQHRPGKGGGTLLRRNAFEGNLQLCTATQSLSHPLPEREALALPPVSTGQQQRL